MSTTPIKTRRKVLLAASFEAEACWRGLQRFARLHDWHVVLDMLYTGAFPRGWRGDGIIALPGFQADLQRHLLDAKLPCVVLATTDDFLRFPRVLTDHKDVGRAAARYLHAQACHQVAFAPFMEDRLSNELLAGLQEGLGKTKITALPAAHRRVGPYWHDDWTSYRERLGARLLELRKPLTIVAGNPAIAAEIRDLCHDLGLHVPDDVSLLSIGSGPAGPQSALESIPCVPYDIEEMAYQAAAILGRMMEGEVVEPTTLVPAGPMIAHTTTPARRPLGTTTAQAIDYIASHYSDPLLGVTDVAEAVGVSRRHLERSFRQETGVTVNTHIINQRMQEASRLLRTHPRAKVNEIGELVGFLGVGSFHRAFRRHFQQTPAQHRSTAPLTPSDEPPAYSIKSA